ncbi:MAG: acetyl esterase/lipase [Halioglobus sp.]|jgi:acetyl esterase/lipase
MNALNNFFRNLKFITIMVYSIILGRAFLRKFKPETLCYCDSVGEKRLLDLYRPLESTTKPLPLIVWFHGGAWKMGDRKSVERIVGQQLERGFAVASVSYSLSDIAQWPTQCHEAKAALRYLRANANTLGLNPDMIVAAGMSAGGHMACMLGVSADHEELNGELGDHCDQSNAVQGVLALYPPTDFLQVPEDFDGLLDYYAEDSPVTALLGETIKVAPDKSDLASPLQLAQSSCPPTFLLHGGADPIVPVGQSELMHSALLKLGVESQLMTVEKYTHGDYRFNRDEPADKICDFLSRLVQS